jgi:hypothetical protein
MALKTSTKIIIGVILFLVLISLYGYKKAKKLKAIFEQITINPTGFRNLKMSLTDIRLDVDVEMFNPTTDNFDVSGYIVTLNRLNFFYNGKYLATAKPLLSEVSIPANDRLKISNVPVVLPTSSIVAYAMEFLTFDFAKLSVEAVIEVAGTEIFIKQ